MKTATLTIALSIALGANASGCSGGVCAPKTNAELQVLQSECFEIRILQTELETLDGLEDFDQPSSLSVTENENLIDVSAIPSALTTRNLARNNALERVIMTNVSGQVSFTANKSLRTITYDLGEPISPPSDGEGTGNLNTLFISGNTPLESIELSCRLSLCSMYSLEIGSMTDTGPMIDTDGNAVPNSRAPDLDELSISIQENIEVSELKIGALDRLSTLKPFYDVPVTDMIQIFNLPALADGEPEAFLAYLNTEGFAGRFEICDDSLGNGCQAVE